MQWFRSPHLAKVAKVAKVAKNTGSGVMVIFAAHKTVRGRAKNLGSVAR
jgi:hypothetical protein